MVREKKTKREQFKPTGKKKRRTRKILTSKNLAGALYGEGGPTGQGKNSLRGGEKRRGATEKGCPPVKEGICQPHSTISGGKRRENGRLVKGVSERKEKTFTEKKEGGKQKELKYQNGQRGRERRGKVVEGFCWNKKKGEGKQSKKSRISLADKGAGKIRKGREGVIDSAANLP